eukprot:2587300-Alexandrium_andersonii.AAC.1
MHTAASGPFDSARNCSEHFRAPSGTFGRFQAFSGSLGLRRKPTDSDRKRLKVPESAGKCRKVFRAVSGRIEAAWSSIMH